MLNSYEGEQEWSIFRRQGNVKEISVFKSSHLHDIFWGRTIPKKGNLPGGNEVYHFSLHPFI